MEEYKKLAEEFVNETGWKICDIDNGTFWILWEQTGAFNSFEDAKENSIEMNEQNEVIWGYCLDDLKQLLNK